MADTNVNVGTGSTRRRTTGQGQQGTRPAAGGRSARLRNRSTTAGLTANPHYLRGLARGLQMAFQEIGQAARIQGHK